MDLEFVWKQLQRSSHNIFDLVMRACWKWFCTESLKLGNLHSSGYSSNFRFKVILPHPLLWGDHVKILDGPPNCNEMLLFFFSEKAVGLERNDKSAVLEWGDTVIMDNRGFHHIHFVQPLLNDMLNKYGVHLLFHLAYSSHLNTFEMSL